MKERQQFKRVDYRTQEELEAKLLEKLDLSKLASLWEVQEAGSDHEFLCIQGNDFLATLSRAPIGAKEGRFVAALVSIHQGVRAPRGWPRHYFDHYRAKCEVGVVADLQWTALDCISDRNRDNNKQGVSNQ